LGKAITDSSVIEIDFRHNLLTNATGEVLLDYIYNNNQVIRCAIDNNFIDLEIDREINNRIYNNKSFILE